MNSKDPTEEYIGKLLQKSMKHRGFADYDWKEHDYTYFKISLSKIKEYSEKGLASIEYLNRKYENT